MNKFKKHSLILLATIYCCLFILKKMGVYVYLLSDYAADILSIPLAILMVEFIHSKLRPTSFRIGSLAVWITVFYFTIVFEWMMPAFSDAYTRDIFDVICYVGGGILYLKLFKQNTISSFSTT